MENDASLMTTEEAAKFLGVKKSTVYAWGGQRRIPYIKVGRLLKFRPKALERWLKEQEIQQWP